MRIPDFIPFGLAATGALVIPVSALGAEFPTIEEAKKILSSGRTLTPVNRTLSRAEAKLIQKASGDKVRERKLRVWKIAGGGALFVDRVRGKHEWITYAAAVDKSGRVTGVEILEYLETHGYQIQNKNWQAQFLGKKATAEAMRFDEDIRNISGATISCRNLTRGLRRLSSTYNLVIHQNEG